MEGIVVLTPLLQYLVRTLVAQPYCMKDLSPGHQESTTPLYILHKLTRRLRNSAEIEVLLQDPRFLLNSVSPGYHSTNLLYILHKLTRRYINSAEIGDLAVRTLQAQEATALSTRVYVCTKQEQELAEVDNNTT